MRRKLWCLVPIIFLLALGGCADDSVSDSGPTTGVGTADSPSQSGTDQRRLVFGITQYPSTLNPNVESMTAKSIVLGMAVRALTTVDHDWETACSLCTELPTLENGRAELIVLDDGSQGMRLRWELKPGLSWGDGSPLTTGDFRFAWEVGRHPQSGAVAMEMWRAIRDIEIIDDRNMHFTIDRRAYNYNNLYPFTPLPEHLERSVFEDAPAEYMNRSLYQTEPTNPGLYHGPYVIAEVERGSHIGLVRNPHWAGKAPYFDEIVVRALERTTTLEANLLSGNLDMIYGELGLSIDQALAFERRHGDAYQVVYEPGLLYEHIDLNLDNPILKDRRVRQALMYAIDREQMAEELFGGRQPVAATFVHPMDPPHTTEGVRTYSYDPERAAALLEDAGWTLGEDGIRRNAEGQRLQLEIMTTAGAKLRELVQQVLQSQWRASGIDVRIRNEAPRIFFGETTRKREYDSMAMFAWASAPESTPRPVLHSSEIPTPENNFAGQNYTGYANPEMDELIVAIESELDPEARRDLWKRAQQIYAEDLPVLPLYYRSNVHIMPNWLEGLRPTGHIISATTWVEDWTRAE
ncbi:peptide ABC transporter substrate-binding protein [Lentisalinibacter sediminis]|uniref:peptide ABC transporter substrate-binding protein n=1 Tax=Lentisalinibacter sediminis TaxID=2992237 RepID=UPI0038699826